MTAPGLHIIGLCGAAGAGKSTVAQLLEQHHGYSQIALADPILDMVHALFAAAGVDGAWAVERSLKEQPTTLGFSYRHLAQSLGTEWGRNTIAPDLWLRVAAGRINQLRLHQADVVVSDIRFPDEAAWLLQKSGTLVCVHRAGIPGARPHESEAHWPSLPATHHIHNDGSLATLADSVHRLVLHLNRPTT